MPFNGSGTFQRVMNWVNDAASNIKIRADRHDQEDDNFAAGLSMCLTKDGQTTPTADIKLGGKKLINVGDPINDQDAVTKAWVSGNVVGGARIADVAPTAKDGELWWESDTGNLFLRYNDGSSTQWVQVNVAAPVDPTPKTGQWVLLQTINVAGLTTIDFDYETAGWPTQYDQFQIEGQRLVPAVQTGNNFPFLRVKSGGVWQNGATAYSWDFMGVGNSGTFIGEGSTVAGGTVIAATGMALGRSVAGNNFTNPGWEGTITFLNPTDAAAASEMNLIRWEGAYMQGTGAPLRFIGAGNLGSASLNQGVRITLASGAFTKGTAKLWGRAR